MAIKLKVIAVSLLGFISTCMADTQFFDHSAISVMGENNQHGYKILINQLVKNHDPNKNFLDPEYKLTMVDKPIWSFTTNQLPITENDCLEVYSGTCSKNEESEFCHNHCLMGSPDVLAFDEKANKFYFLVGTRAIGTGGGPAFLFVGDVNKKEIKLLHEEPYQEQGSLSPSGRYFLMYGYSVIKMYDTKGNNTRIELNESENIYTKDQDIRHKLLVKKWLNDTQFIYVDIARYFVRPIPDDGEPFYSAKEVTYDIASRKPLNQREITKKQADDYEKSL